MTSSVACVLTVENVVSGWTAVYKQTRKALVKGDVFGMILETRIKEHRLAGKEEWWCEVDENLCPNEGERTTRTLTVLFYTMLFVVVFVVVIVVF